MKSHGFVDVGGIVLRLQPCTAVSGQACQVWGEESVECMFQRRRLLVQVVQDLLISLMLLSSVECCEDGHTKGWRMSEKISPTTLRRHLQELADSHSRDQCWHPPGVRFLFLLHLFFFLFFTLLFF